MTDLVPRVQANGRWQITLDHHSETASEEAVRSAILAFAVEADAEQWDALREDAKSLRAITGDEQQQYADDLVAAFDATLHDIIPRHENWPDTRLYANNVPALHTAIEHAVHDEIATRRAS